MTAMPKNAHLLDARGRLNAGDYEALCWPVLECLMAALLTSGLGTAAVACGSLQWTDEVSGRPQSMKKLRLTRRRPPQRGSVKNGLCTLHLLMPVLSGLT